jgi:hypothetical protein
MAAIDWPSGLPQYPLSDGFNEAIQDGTIRSRPDIGAEKVRRRFTALAVRLSIKYQLTASEKAILDSFYKTTTRGGTLRFDWPHPVDGTVEARFAAPPSYSALEVEVIAAVQLEVLP